MNDCEMLSLEDIACGLRELGLKPGDKVLVHSSIAALGSVDGGADTVIDALLGVVGPEGLVVVPTFACVAPFDRKTSKTPLGAVADRFWRRPEAFRSLHPTHSVAAIGKGAQELISDHEKAPTAYAEGTPYHKLTQQGGKILLLGVDQDRNTTLHTAESLAGSPYLKSITADYVDENCSVINIPIADMAGPHRDFIGLDKLFRQSGIMTIGKIGSAVCRLMEAGPMLKIALEALQADPAAVLCSNPECSDCLHQRGMIKAARLAREDFRLVARAADISDRWEDILGAIRSEGIDALELTAAEYMRFSKLIESENIDIVGIHATVHDAIGVAAARRLGVPLTIPVASQEDLEVVYETHASGVRTIACNAGMPSEFYTQICQDSQCLGLAFNPAQFAAAGEKPFLQVFYKGSLRRITVQFYVDDATSAGLPTLPGCGNGEIKEIISMLRCRSYTGNIVLRNHLPGVSGFRRSAAAFWNLLDNM